MPLLMAYFLLAERLNRVQIAGSLMILSGVVFLRLYQGGMARQIKLRAGSKWRPG